MSEPCLRMFILQGWRQDSKVGSEARARGRASSGISRISRRGTSGGKGPHPSWWGHHQKIAIFEAKTDSKFKFSALAPDFSAVFNENRIFKQNFAFFF